MLVGCGIDRVAGEPGVAAAAVAGEVPTSEVRAAVLAGAEAVVGLTPGPLGVQIGAGFEMATSFCPVESFQPLPIMQLANSVLMADARSRRSADMVLTEDAARDWHSALLPS